MSAWVSTSISSIHESCHSIGIAIVDINLVLVHTGTLFVVLAQCFAVCVVFGEGGGFHRYTRVGWCGTQAGGCTRDFKKCDRSSTSLSLAAFKNSLLRTLIDKNR